MAGRYTPRSRYGENLGSIQSRIKAREGLKEKDDVSKIKEARSRKDARLLQNYEGVRSRMNRFGGKVSASSTPKNSPSTTKQKSEKIASGNVTLNGDTDEAARTTRRTGPNKEDLQSSSAPQQTGSKTTSSKIDVEVKVDTASLNGGSSSPAIQSKSLENESEQDLQKTELSEDPPSTPIIENSSSSSVENEEKNVNGVTSATGESPSPQEDITPTDAAAVSKETKSSSPSIDDVTNDDGSSGHAMQSLEEDLANPDQPEPITSQERKRLELGDLDQDLDTSARRRRRARKPQDSARSSEAGSLVSTPDPDSPAPAVKGQITPKSNTPDSSAPVPDPVESLERKLEEEVAAGSEPAQPEEDEPCTEDVAADADDTKNEHDDVIEEKVNNEIAKEVESQKDSNEEVETSQAKASEETQSESVSQQEKVEVTPENSVPENGLQTSEPRYTMENIEKCEDLDYLEKILYDIEVYEDRRRVRSRIRALKKSGVKSAPKSSAASSKSTPSSYQSRTSKTPTSKTTERVTPRAAPKTSSAQTKPKSTPLSGLTSTSKLGNKENKTPPDPKALAEKYGLSTSDKKDTPGRKKVGSIFDREEEAPKKSSRQLDQERRQAERKREMMKHSPATFAASKEARKKFDGGQPSSGSRSSSVVPNANNIKNKLLKWCQVKTRGYENVDIINYSSSWADGMAFCALTHNFFPDAFDYSQLNPDDREKNFNLAFKTAEELGEIPILLDVADLVKMDEPDWKCIYTYLTEFYKHIYEKGMT